MLAEAVVLYNPPKARFKLVSRFFERFSISFCLCWLASISFCNALSCNANMEPRNDIPNDATDAHGPTDSRTPPTFCSPAFLLPENELANPLNAEPVLAAQLKAFDGIFKISLNEPISTPMLSSISMRGLSISLKFLKSFDMADNDLLKSSILFP